MFVRGDSRGWKGLFVNGVVGFGAALVILGTAGCPGAVVSSGSGGDDEIVDGNRNPMLTSNLGKTSGEPNDDFSESVVAVFDSDGVARLQGTVAGLGDLDVYRLGPFSPGERMIVDVYAVDSGLDVTMALFDGEGRLVMNNDDRDNGGCRIVDSQADFIVRHSSDPHYLVITHSPEPCGGGFVGAYRADIVVDSGFEVPRPVGQALLLDFDGGVVTTPLGQTLTLAPFDAADISQLYQGETQNIKDRIRAVFEQNYERFNVTIRTTDDPPFAPGQVHSTISFGGFDLRLFGIADGVDLYNQDCCDDAIIFTESFKPSEFTFAPTADEIGIAIGNVGSHEAGHVLGLNHTDDDLDLMDARSPADAFMEDQEFKEAPLSGDIMSIGTQDGVLLLIESVGEREPN